MKKSYKGTMVLIVAALLMVTNSPDAWSMGRRPEPEKMLKKIEKELGLSKEQKDIFIKDIKKSEEEAKKLHAENRGLMEKIQKEMQKDTPDRKAIEGHLKKISQNEVELQLGRIDQVITFKNALTPEQQKKFKVMFDPKKRPERKERDRAGKRG